MTSMPANQQIVVKRLMEQLRTNLWKRINEWKRWVGEKVENLKTCREGKSSTKRSAVFLTVSDKMQQPNEIDRTVFSSHFRQGRLQIRKDSNVDHTNLCLKSIYCSWHFGKLCIEVMYQIRLCTNRSFKAGSLIKKQSVCSVCLDGVSVWLKRIRPPKMHHQQQ